MNQKISFWEDWLCRISKIANMQHWIFFSFLRYLFIDIVKEKWSNFSFFQNKTSAVVAYLLWAMELKEKSRRLPLSLYCIDLSKTFIFTVCFYRMTENLLISSVSQYVKIVQVWFGCCCFILFGLNAEIYEQFACKPLYTPDIGPKFTMIKTSWMSIRTSEKTFFICLKCFRWRWQPATYCVVSHSNFTVVANNTMVSFLNDIRVLFFEQLLMLWVHTRLIEKSKSLRSWRDGFTHSTPLAFFLYPLKTSENVGDVFRRYRRDYWLKVG